MYFKNFYLICFRYFWRGDDIKFTKKP